MEELGGYRELAPAGRAAGVAVFALALLATALLERLQLKLKARESSRWWASNGRDVVNALAFGAMTLGLLAIGFTGPISLAIAATLVIAISVIESSLSGYPRLSTAIAVAVSLLAGLPVLLFPRLVHALFRGAIERLF